MIEGNSETQWRGNELGAFPKCHWVCYAEGHFYGCSERSRDIQICGRFEKFHFEFKEEKRDGF